ncbi:type VI secretion system Vgr family protein [Pedobacter sp. AW1-32]|uniref:type VI secretion system Vgr family protein n=1 Tax=Pedobacter sp. AW1-32 TaxID=3383026 RepID=UPI003FEE8CDA
MEKKLISEINIEGKAITHFASFSLQQKFNEHHYFELRFNHDQMGAPGLVSLNDSRDFVGKTLTASFGHTPDKLQNFAGLVTKVELAQSHGYHGLLIVSGYSPTILIDRGPDLGSYLNKSLDDIVKLATSDTPANDLKIVSKASRTAPVDYLIQYRESDFDFLNRLSGEYHEWFFYDGEQLNFGKPDEQKEVALFYGRDVQNLQYAMELAPIKNKRFAYNPKQDEMLSSESPGKPDGNPDLAHAIQASNTVYSKTFNQPSLIRVDNNGDIKSYVENEEKANISGLLRINATGDNAELAIGSIAEVTMSLKQELAFVTDSLGKFLITNISHNIDGTGKYHNTFEGLVSTTERILVKNFSRPNPDIQLADVIDNADPQGQGRIKVKFKWQCQTNDVTEWLRVITPDAGSSDKVSKNRGFTFIPEKGDQVVVAFEEGNIARPIVMGSVFHGKIGSGGGDTNKTKSLTTRSGNTIIMNDSDGSINVKDPSGNVITMHGNGQVTLTAPNSFTINTKDFIVNASNSIAINAQPGEEGGGEGTIAISAKKTIAATADTEGITIDATEMGVAITGKTDVSVESTTASATFAGNTDTTIDGADVKMSGTTTIRISSSDTDIT